MSAAGGEVTSSQYRSVRMSEESKAIEHGGGRFDLTDRRALRAIALQFFVNGALFASFMPRMPEIRDRVGISITAVGVLLSVAGLTGLLGSAAVGPAIGRFGTRAVITAAATVVAFSLALIGVARIPAVLLLGLIGMSTFDVLVDVGMNMQASWLSARRHAPVMNRLHGLWSLGTLAGGLGSSRMAAAGISLQVHLVTAAGVLSVVIGLLGRGLLRADESPPPMAPTPMPTTSARPRPARKVGVTLLLFGVAGFFAVTMETTSIDWAAFRLRDDFEAGPGLAALGYVAVTVGMTAARFSGDWAAARLSPRRLMAFSVALAAVGLTTASVAPDPYLTLVGYVAAGAGVATLLPTLYDRAAQLPGRPGRGLGALTAGLRLAGLAVPALVGGLADTGLGVGPAVALVTLPSAAGFFLVARRLGTTPQGPDRAGTA